ncbi:hypothetical protein Srufu_036090 [Streptomyces libani subsp. rufus]|nr:hypothetical protein Srufu_036090 [Streptomyces libani subsp. rufus]
MHSPAPTLLTAIHSSRTIRAATTPLSLAGTDTGWRRAVLLDPRLVPTASVHVTAKGGK